MGREIRRVPPNWEHPRDKQDGGYIPMLDIDYDTAAQRWIDELMQWENKQEWKGKSCRYFWDWDGGPPNEEYHRPVFTEKPTWYQVYETVSEGCPVSPPFETKEELVDYLVEYGDFWDQRRGDGGWTRENAESFVRREWAPSGWMIAGKTRLMAPRDGEPFKDYE
jgi:hypothetical protein